MNFQIGSDEISKTMKHLTFLVATKKVNSTIRHLLLKCFAKAPIFFYTNPDGTASDAGNTSWSLLLITCIKPIFLVCLVVCLFKHGNFSHCRTKMFE